MKEIRSIRLAERVLLPINGCLYELPRFDEFTIDVEWDDTKTAHLFSENWISAVLAKQLLEEDKADIVEVNDIPPCSV